MALTAAEEKKRKRLEAWRARKAAAAAKLAPKKVVLNVAAAVAPSDDSQRKKKKKKKRKRPTKSAAELFDEEDDDEDDQNENNDNNKDDDDQNNETKSPTVAKKRRTETEETKKDDVVATTTTITTTTTKTSRWDVKKVEEGDDDALDEFMEGLDAVPKQEDVAVAPPATTTARPPPKERNLVMTAEDLMRTLSNNDKETKGKGADKDEKDGEKDDPEEEETKEDDDDAFLRALVDAPGPAAAAPQRRLLSEVRDEERRRRDRLDALRSAAAASRKEASADVDVGRLDLYGGDDGDVPEEAERDLGAALEAPTDALAALAELNKRRELRLRAAGAAERPPAVPVNRNLYVVPRRLAALSKGEIARRRARMRVRVRGVGCPAPVERFEDCGLSERVLAILHKQGIEEPFPVQAQCLPAVMGGRDVIGIAKTGSGKTLAYLLPMLRHILDQPDLGPHESGPIGLVLAPARELAAQIHGVCRTFCRQLGINDRVHRENHDSEHARCYYNLIASTAVYGGAGVAEQIGDLKRGVRVAVATPGRLIDILTMQSGRLIDLGRVSYVVLDEADRMFDMGFAPQISAVLSAVRPDRQTVLFSATFPRAVENLARRSLRTPIEVVVGGRSVASEDVTQYGEVVEESDKFLRLLQLLGEDSPEHTKTLVFVDTQARADSVFSQLVRHGYPSLSLHGGKEQEDRDSTVADFRRPDGPAVLVATSVAGRGLDVKDCGRVVNYSAPNHLEDYVHRVGRTGRAGARGVAHTLCNPGDEARFAPTIVRAMTEAGQEHNASDELKALAEEFAEKCERGEARRAGSGFKGKGYTYDSGEMNEAQRIARSEKRQALIEAGLLDPEEEEEAMGAGAGATTNTTTEDSIGNNGQGMSAAVDISTKLSDSVLALPGMQEAILRKVGVASDDPADAAANDGSGNAGNNPNHFVEEIEINDYPREARWKVTQKETTSQLQDEFQTAVTLKGEYFGPNRVPAEGERRLYLHLEATTERILKNCVLEIRRLLNEETLRVGARSLSGGHRYNVL